MPGSAALSGGREGENGYVERRGKARGNNRVAGFAAELDVDRYLVSGGQPRERAVLSADRSTRDPLPGEEARHRHPVVNQTFTR